MKKLNKKILSIAIGMFFILSMIASLTLSVNAQTLGAGKIDIASYAFVHCGPNPIGVGQTLTVGFWIGMPPPTASGPYGDRYTGMKVTVTEPNGQNETLGPFTSDDTGGTSTTFVPTTSGTYSFTMSYPGQFLTGGPNGLIPGATSLVQSFVGDYVEPATSSPFSVTVQQAPVGGVIPAPLPTTYWQTPINAMNVNNWYAIGGASLLVTGYSTASGAEYNSSTNYNPYTLAPTTSHILWTEPEAFGGAMGGQFGGTTSSGNYYSTEQYEHKFEQIVMNGYLYYTQYTGSSTTPIANICINLYNGQTVWTDNSDNYGGGSPAQTALTSTGLVTPLYFGQILNFVTPNQFGGLAYLFTQGTPAGIVSTGTTLNMFDAMTGKYILSVVNGTAFTAGPNPDSFGNDIGYYVNNTACTQQAGYVTYKAGSQSVMGTINDNIGPSPQEVTLTGPTINMWNSTECILAGSGAWSVATASGWEWRPPQNGVIPFADGLTWTEPVSTTVSGNPVQTLWSLKAVADSIVLANTPYISVANSGSVVNAGFDPGWVIYAGYSLTTGQQLWIENLTVPAFGGLVNTGTASGDGIFTVASKSVYAFSGYSMTTGALLWTTPLTGTNGAPPDSYDSIGGYLDVIANNTLYLAGFGGDIWSINVQNGKINWYTNTTAIQGPAGTNSPYGVWPIWSFSAGNVADGILFLPEGHEYSPPLFLGAQLLAINCTNGKLVWSQDAFDVDSHPITADGIMTDLNAYNNEIYAYGQGPSKTTVSAPQIGVTTATPITITGSVTDISAGASQEVVAADYPNGLPCVSDASMTPFMEAVYDQQPMPTNLTGVPVTISVTDSNHNTYAIGTAISSPTTGEYSLTWTPVITGNYTVTAIFAGTGGYYGSIAQTGFYASSPAATQAPTATPATGLASNTTVEYGIAAIAVIIIVIGAVLALLVTRKHP